MKNPFEYGGVVSGSAFCNRQKEVTDLLQAIENNEKLFVFSERRYGKTSLDRKSTRLNSSHIQKSRMPSSA